MLKGRARLRIEAAKWLQIDVGALRLPSSCELAEEQTAHCIPKAAETQETAYVRLMCIITCFETNVCMWMYVYVYIYTYTYAYLVYVSMYLSNYTYLREDS